MSQLEVDLKSTVLNYLIDKGRVSASSTLINELTLNKFARRVDLAIVNNAKTYAFEIKSASDTLDRLEGQIEKYLNYFDKVVVVAAPKHIQKTIAIVPPNVAVWEACGEKMRVIQRGQSIPVMHVPSLLGLIKACELRRLSNKLNLVVTSNVRRQLEKEILSAKVSNKIIREFCLQCVERRYLETSSRFFSHVLGRRIEPEDIDLLSRSYFHRKRMAQRKAARENSWTNFYECSTHAEEWPNISFGDTPKSIRELMAA